MDTIESVIKELEDIKEKEGNLPVTWGDGYWAERELVIMVLAEPLMPCIVESRRVCLSRRVVPTVH